MNKQYNIIYIYILCTMYIIYIIYISDIYDWFRYRWIVWRYSFKSLLIEFFACFPSRCKFRSVVHVMLPSSRRDPLECIPHNPRKQWHGKSGEIDTWYNSDIVFFSHKQISLNFPQCWCHRQTHAVQARRLFHFQRHQSDRDMKINVDPAPGSTNVKPHVLFCSMPI